MEELCFLSQEDKDLERAFVAIERGEVNDAHIWAATTLVMARRLAVAKKQQHLLQLLVYELDNRIQELTENAR